MRRQDRAVTDEAWIADMLRWTAVGTLATAADGQPYLHINLFAYDAPARALYLHTAREGRARSSMEGGGRVCFAVHEMGRLLPAATALNMSVEYASVVVFGRAVVVGDPAEARRALQLLLDKYFAHLAPGRDYRPITDEELARTAVYRIDIEAWSGKRKQAAADFPGAFSYPPPSG
jgi:nitroimidazol reductase NimA-like FMN-containing flavoprotein (pyridoxamine 5'-phosphate oxidase superfamily)